MAHTMPETDRSDSPPLTEDRSSERHLAESRFAILSHIGMGNMGDELMFASAIRNLSDRRPGASFLGFTIVPADTGARHPVEAAHHLRPPADDSAGADEEVDGRDDSRGGRLTELLSSVKRELQFSRDCARRLRNVDAVVFAGSGQFNDNYGGWRGYPLTLLRWTLLARLMGVPVFFLSQGVQSLSSRISRWMTRATVSLATYVSVRDPGSRDRLRSEGIRREIPVVPDIALGYPLPAEGTWERGHRDAPLRVGINPIPFFHPSYWSASDDETYPRYLEGLVELACTVLEKGHRLTLYPTHEWADQIVIRDMIEGIEERSGADAAAAIERAHVGTLEELWSVLSTLDCTVASRYHGVISGLITHTPTLAIAYQDKTLDLADMIGFTDVCIPIREADGTTLVRAFELVTAGDVDFEGAVASGLSAAYDQVQHQFDILVETAFSDDS